MPKLLSSLPVGAKVKDTQTTYNGKPILFTIMEHNHAGDPAGSTALVTTNIITFKCFDAKEPRHGGSTGVASNGNNRYSQSNIAQWLNSDKPAGQWYVAQHEADEPPSSEYVAGNHDPYDQEAGFLTSFSAKLKQSLMTVTKRTAKNTVVEGGGYEDVSQKVFLLSTTEVGLPNENYIAEGTIYTYFSNVQNLRTYPTAEAVASSYFNSPNFSASKEWQWWLRTPKTSYANLTCHSLYADVGMSSPNSSLVGVRPACVVSSSISVSDTADTDGAYTMVWNTPPVISTTENLGDKNAPFDLKYTITDADNDSVITTVALDGSVVQTINQVVLGREYNVNISAAKIISLVEGRHTFVINARDTYGNSSTKTVVFNRIKSSIAISGADTSLGNKWQPFETVYQVSDSGNKSITVTEYIDNTVTRTITGAPQGENITFDLSGFDALEDEQTHQMTIKAVNSDGAEVYRYINFIKLPKELSFEIKPVETDAPAKQIMIILNYDETGKPEVKVEVTNCPYNEEVIWEDATEAYKTGEIYNFTNTASDGDMYGVAVRVTVAKNSSTERVRVFAVGYNFE